MWIQWVGNERVFLGKMPYPWEFYGKYLYTEFVPLFDIISAIGDSIPRLHRFLQSLHNATVGQRKDLIRNLLKPIVLQRVGEDVPDEQIEKAFFRLITVKDPKNFAPFLGDSPALASAFSGAIEEEAQIMRMWALSDPSISNTESGTGDNPQAGKTATTAVLAAKSSDALIQFKLDSLNAYFKESGQKKLWMLSRTSETLTIHTTSTPSIPARSKPYSEIRQDRLSLPVSRRTSGRFGVEPEAMSMLSADDDIRRQAGQTLLQMADRCLEW